MLLSQLLKRMVRIGTLTVIDADGRSHFFVGEKPGPSCTIRFHDRRTQRRLFFNPKLCLGEAYVDGTLTVEDGDIYDFLSFCAENLGWGEPDQWVSKIRNVLARALRRFKQYNPLDRARSNIAHHYDLSAELYDLFLDADRQYSCGYFLSPDDSLETAQENKKRHIAAKLLLEPGQKVLDIGSGWGGLALSLAKNRNLDVTGITLSKEQCTFAQNRAKKVAYLTEFTFHLKIIARSKANLTGLCRSVCSSMWASATTIHFSIRSANS